MNFSFTMTTDADNRATGMVTFQFRLNDVTGAMKVAPLTANVSITVQRREEEGEQCEFQLCDNQNGFVWDSGQCCCANNGVCESPIIIDISGNGYNLTNFENGVRFDLYPDGRKEQISWTRAGSDDAFLVLDRDYNGTIDNGKEMFGNFTPQGASDSPNGFIALAEYDKAGAGGNEDGIINDKDLIFWSLRLWQDVNHNGVSEQSELRTLSDLGIIAIHLDHKESKRKDRHGNVFRYRAKVDSARHLNVGRWAWDVFFVGR
jgi:hypothetical protein